MTKQLVVEMLKVFLRSPPVPTTSIYRSALRLLFPNALEQVIFVSPAKSLQYQAAANDLKNYQVMGSEENELMNQFRQETSRLKDTKIPDIAKQYITDHASSPVALYLFDRYFIQAMEPSTSDLAKMQKLLKKHHQIGRAHV